MWSPEGLPPYPSPGPGKSRTSFVDELEVFRYSGSGLMCVTRGRVEVYSIPHGHYFSIFVATPEEQGQWRELVRDIRTDPPTDPLVLINIANLFYEKFKHLRTNSEVTKAQPEAEHYLENLLKGVE